MVMEPLPSVAEEELPDAVMVPEPEPPWLEAEPVWLDESDEPEDDGDEEDEEDEVARFDVSVSRWL